MPAEGFLKVRVSTARGAIPLQGAKVAVRGTTADNSGIVALLTTDSGGLTPTLALPAPAKADSGSPGNVKPFSEYNLEISLDGYQTQYYYNLPIFATFPFAKTVIPISATPTIAASVSSTGRIPIFSAHDGLRGGTR